MAPNFRKLPFRDPRRRTSCCGPSARRHSGRGAPGNSPKPKLQPKAEGTPLTTRTRSTTSKAKANPTSVYGDSFSHSLSLFISFGLPFSLPLSLYILCLIIFLCLYIFLCVSIVSFSLLVFCLCLFIFLVTFLFLALLLVLLLVLRFVSCSSLRQLSCPGPGASGTEKLTAEATLTTTWVRFRV